jgi:hypothetical protein
VSQASGIGWGSAMAPDITTPAKLFLSANPIVVASNGKAMDPIPPLVGRPGLLVACGLLAALGVLGLSQEPHWFFLVCMALGGLGVALSFNYAPAGRQEVLKARPEDSLRLRLLELERLHGDGLLSRSEYRRKREAMIGAWGNPEGGAGGGSSRQSVVESGDLAH